MEVPVCALLSPGQGCVLDEGVLQQRCSDKMRIVVFHGSLQVPAQLRMSLRAGTATSGLLSEEKGCPELSPSLGSTELTQWEKRQVLLNEDISVSPLLLPLEEK